MDTKNIVFDSKSYENLPRESLIAIGNIITAHGFSYLIDEASSGLVINLDNIPDPREIISEIYPIIIR